MATAFGVALVFIATRHCALSLEAKPSSDSDCNNEVADVSFLQTTLGVSNASGSLAAAFVQQSARRQEHQHLGNKTGLTFDFSSASRELTRETIIALCILPVVLVVVFLIVQKSEEKQLDGVVEKLLSNHGEMKAQECGWYQAMFFYHINHEFARHAEEAFRATCVFVCYAIPFFLPAKVVGGGMSHIIDMGVYSNFIGQQILFNYQVTLGGTIAMVCQTTFGTFVAFFTIWTMLGFYPDGVSLDDNGDVYGVGIVCCIVFVISMLWLNFPLKVTIFALARFAEYIMAFLNPTADVRHHYSVGFHIKLGGNAMKAFLATFIGGLFAVGANLIPFPKLSLVEAEMNACIVLGQLRRSWDTFKGFMHEGSKRQDVMSMMQRELFKTKQKIDDCNRDLDTAWWECIAYRSRQRTRAVLTALNKANWQMYIQLLGAIQCCTADDTFADRHVELMQRIERSVSNVLEMAGESNYTAALYMRDASSGQEQKYLATFAESQRKMHASISALTREFRSAKRSMGLAAVHEEFTEEHVFCRAVCELGRTTAELLNTLSLDIKGERIIVADYKGPSPLSVFDVSKILSKEKILTACRLTITFGLVFVVGYFGYEGIIDQYTFSIPCTMALLISPGRGLQVVKNMLRLQGVVLGTAIGALTHAFFVKCTLMSSLGSISVVAAWIWLNLIGFFMNREFSYLCFVLALFGQNKMVVPCGNADATHFTMVFEVVVTIGIMTVVDMLTPTQTAADMAATTVENAWSKIQDLFEYVVDPNPLKAFTAQKSTDRRADIRQLITQAMSIGADAEGEPRFAKVAWRTNSFNLAVSMIRLLQSSLISVEDLLHADEKVSQKIVKLPSFQRLAELLRKEMSDIRNLLVIFRHEKSHHIPQLGCNNLKFADTAEHAVVAGEFAKDISRLQEELTPDPKKPESLEFDPATNVCQIVACLDSMRNAMGNFHATVLLNG